MYRLFTLITRYKTTGDSSREINRLYLCRGTAIAFLTLAPFLVQITGSFGDRRKNKQRTATHFGGEMTCF